jgi:hypothetical protein
MRKLTVRCIVLLSVLTVGFAMGRLTKPPSVKASTGATRVVHVQVSDSTTVPGWGTGTATGISCLPAQTGADCYVILQGN